MEVDDDGNGGRLGVRVRGGRGGEDARPQAAGGVDGDVGGAHPRGIRAGRGAKLEVAEGEEKVSDTAVPAMR